MVGPALACSAGGATPAAPPSAAGASADSGASGSTPITAAPPSPTPTVTPSPAPSPTPWAAAFDLAFVRDGNIWLGRAEGGNQVQLTTAGRDSEPAWSPAGERILFARGSDGEKELFSMRADGRDLRRLTNDRIEQRHATWSPDGQWIAFQQALSSAMQDADRERCQIVVIQADGSGATPIADGCEPAWSPSGLTIAYSRAAAAGQNSAEGGLWLWALGGLDRPLLSIGDLPDDLAPRFRLPFRPAVRWLGEPAWSPSGRRLAAVAQGATGLAVTFDEQGRGLRVLQANYRGSVGRPRFAPHGATLALESRPASGYGHVLLIDLVGDRRVRLGDERDDVSAVEPAWSPDGGRLAVVLFAGPLAAPASSRELAIFDARGRLQGRVAIGDVRQPAWRAGR